ncbi:MAG: basic amino acid/polyamine antiporter [Lactobacillaceae bacterium]|jgi:arginine:ornithine antiporter/lysine permease|nr:basic amino acid/polyamine antiporter [Lactobacillaceae bacterium]
MNNKKGISLIALTSLVVSSSIGAGIFDIPSSLAKVATPGVALLAWFITGFGILMLALSFSNLVLNKPELNGVSDYARAGFGNFAGFLSGWGYWLGVWLGNVAFGTMLMSTLGYFFKELRSGNSLQAVLFASMISWGLTLLVMRGVEAAAVINVAVTIAKLIPLFVFIVLAILLFKVNIFSEHFWMNLAGNASHLSFSKATPTGILNQVSSSLISLIWVFVGIEGAAMMADRARRKSDAAKATVFGLVALFILYVVISILPYGYMSQGQIAQLETPSLMYLMEAMIGPVGGVIISIGLVISILGSWLSWTMLPVEATSQMSEQKLLPKWFGKMNKYNAPANSLIFTQALVQIFFLSLLKTNEAYNFAYSLATVAIIISYILVSAYQFKLGIQEKSLKNTLIGFLSLTFQLVAVIIAGLNFLWLTTVAYFVGFVFYLAAQKQNEKKITATEWILIAVISILAILAVISVLIGRLSF